MTIKTKFNIGDIVTFYPLKMGQDPIKGTIVDLYIYLGYGIKSYRKTLRILYIVQSGEQGYNVYEEQIISGYKAKRRKRKCVVPQSD